MTESYSPVRTIDGKQLYASFIAGAQRIIAHQKLLNDINVFPVPDADTGTNLAATMRSMQDAVIPATDVRGTALALADAAMTGARGNSGIIFAQFLYGFGNELPSSVSMDVKTFTESMKLAVPCAYEAMANPVEGTILTVIREWADCLYMLRDSIDDFIRLFTEAYTRAFESLAGTTAQLEQLSRANVVDAGAKGFVFFLEGIRNYFSLGGGDVPAEEISEVFEPVVMQEIPHEKITHRFCTEAILSGTLPGKTVISERIGSLGDSLAMAGTPRKCHVHIHTDQPAEVIARLQQIATVTWQKADDMVFQQEIRTNRKSDIALLTDSGCDLPQQLLEQYQIHVIPLTIHFGDTFFLDRITMMPQEFYAMLKSSPVRPSTSQPSVREFQSRYEYLLAHYQSVISVHFSENLSGTFATSLKTAQEMSTHTGKRIDVVNSASLTGGLGLLALRVAKAIAEGVSHEAIIQQVPDWKSKIVLRVGFDSLKYIVKGGRVSPLKGFIGSALDLKPAIAITKEGKPDVFSTAFTQKSCLSKVLENITREISGKPVWGYAITHTNQPEKVAHCVRHMEQLTGQKPLFTEYTTPGIVANTGFNTCITAMLE